MVFCFVVITLYHKVQQYAIFIFIFELLYSIFLETILFIKWEVLGYKYLEEVADCAIESVSAEKQKISKTASLNNVNSFHSHIKERYYQYRGVATKYINRYNSLFSATYRMKDDLEDEIYNLLSTRGNAIGPIKCKDVYTRGHVEL